MSQEAVQLPVEEEPKKTKPTEEPKKTKPTEESLELLLNSLKSLQDDIGQICELTSEEKRVVAVFFESLLKIMQPLAKAMPVSTVALPEEIGNVVQANVDPTGHLMILYKDGQAELRNLSEETERDLMISVIKDVMPKFKQLTCTQRRKIENRIRFLSSVTEEVQKISEAFSTATT